MKRLDLFWGLLLVVPGCGWYDGMHPPNPDGPAGQVQTLELGLSSEASGTVLDLDTGLTDTYSYLGECTRAIMNTGWDLKVDPDGLLSFNPRTDLEVSNQPGARPDQVALARADFGPATDRRLASDLLLVRTDLGAVVAVFDAKFDPDGQRVRLSIQPLRAGACDPDCSPVDRPVRPSSQLRLDLSAGWIVSDTGALCGTPAPEPDFGMTYDLTWQFGSMEALVGGLDVEPDDPTRALVMTAEGLVYNLDVDLDERERVVRIIYALAE